MKPKIPLALLASFFSVALSAHAQIIADAAADYQAGTINAVMTPVTDTHGTGTWTYDLVQVNSDSNPTGISSPEILTYQNDTDGGSTPLYGTTGAYSYSVLDLPAVSNGQIFPDSPSPAAGFLEIHPGGGTNAAALEWTAGAGETGTLSLTFDFSRNGIGTGGLSTDPGAGFDDFTIYQNGTSIYSDDAIFVGSDTGAVTLTLSGVTAGTTVDFVTSATNGVLGFNAAYLSAQIDAVPEPSTWALMGGGLVVLSQVVRRRLAACQG